ncbi:hypothetical protein [Nocardia abscessus]|uniref:hypothetical protein n=1 Tax=Nocardia abscessus TaxID=120957 RepID=UPI0024579092|nr:hypothetical protein [Nocardia abscessus]
MPPGIEFGWRRHGEAVAVGRFGPPGLWITATGNLRLPLVEHDQGQAVEEDGGVCGQGIDNRHRPRRFRCDSRGQRSAYFSPHGLGQNEAILVTTHTGWARPDLEIHSRSTSLWLGPAGTLRSRWTRRPADSNSYETPISRIG